MVNVCSIPCTNIEGELNWVLLKSVLMKKWAPITNNIAKQRMMSRPKLRELLLLLLMVDGVSNMLRVIC